MIPDNAASGMDILELGKFLEGYGHDISTTCLINDPIHLRSAKFGVK